LTGRPDLFAGSSLTLWPGEKDGAIVSAGWIRTAGNGGAKGAVVAIVTLIVWVLTAGAGISLLTAGNAARRRAAGARAASPPARLAALPLTDDGGPPPSPHAKVVAPPGEHPVLEFSHPALALTGLGFWFGFTLVHYRPLAWISFGVLAVTLAAGLGWLTANTLAARRRQDAARAFPRRLVVLHGLAATATIALTVLTALSAGR